MSTKSVKREYEDQNFWNVMASIFFSIVLVVALAIIVSVRGSFPTSIPLFDFILLILASFRITRLVVYDKITRFFRELFMDIRIEEVDGIKTVVLTPAIRGIRGTLYDLLMCPWCIGIWSALIVTFCYFLFSWAWVVIFILAISGVSTLIQLTANMIGWTAERLKIETQISERSQ